MASLEEGEMDAHVYPVFSIVPHLDEDYFFIDVHDPDNLYYLDLKSVVCWGFRLDCKVKLIMVGRMCGDRRLVVNDDESMMLWLQDNSGDTLIHLDVEIMNPPIAPSHEEPVNTMNVDDVESDDNSYVISDEEQCEFDFSGDEGLEVEDKDNDVGGLDDYDTEVIATKLNEVGSDENIPYLDRDYRGKVVNQRGHEIINMEQGMLFQNVDVFREVLKDYVIQEGFETIRTRNEKARIIVHCVDKGYDWYLHASVHPNESIFETKVYHANHTYVKMTTNSEVTSTWIAHKMGPQFRADLNMSYSVIAEHLMSKYGVKVKKHQMYGAKKKTLKMVKGSHAKSYGKLRKYAMMVKKAILGTSTLMNVDKVYLSHKPAFKRFFLCMKAVKEGFKHGCRQFIGMDGCHLNRPFGGVLLSIVSLDGNNGLFPLVVPIVEVKNRDSWTWVLQLLETCVGNFESNQPLVLMFYKQKGLVDVIANVFPYAQQGTYCRHLYNNFISQFPEVMLMCLFWKAVKSYTNWEFNEAMEEIKKLNSATYDWLTDIALASWSRHAFDPRSKSDHFTNNMSESFNDWIDSLRGLACNHALARITYLMHDIVTYCDKAYKKSNYQLCYKEMILPVANLSKVDLLKDDIDIVQPLLLKRRPDRPRKNRRLEKGEQRTQGAIKRSITLKCANCHQFGHKKRTCQKALIAGKKKIRTIGQHFPIAVDRQASTSSATSTNCQKWKRKTGRARRRCTRSAATTDAGLSNNIQLGQSLTQPSQTSLKIALSN